jgi:HPt (histidine-containing phosphotransfer) domain-containing protein
VSDAIDPAAIDELLRMVGDDREFVGELIDTYLEDSPKQLEAMRDAIREEDASALVRPAHTLKSNSRNLGATALAELCAELEAGARRGDLSGASERVAAAEAAFAAARLELAGMRSA